MAATRILQSCNSHLYRTLGPLVGKLLFKSKLRHGRNSYASIDVEFLGPDFLGLADGKTQRFLEKYKRIDEIQLPHVDQK